MLLNTKTFRDETVPQVLKETEETQEPPVHPVLLELLERREMLDWQDSPVVMAVLELPDKWDPKATQVPLE